LRELRSRSGLSRQKAASPPLAPRLPLRCAPGLRFGSALRPVTLFALPRPALGQLPVLLVSFNAVPPQGPQSLCCPFCPPPAVRPRPFIFDFAVRWRSRRDIGRRRGLLWLRFTCPTLTPRSPLRCAPGLRFGDSLRAAFSSRPSGRGRRAGGAERCLLIYNQCQVRSLTEHSL